MTFTIIREQLQNNEVTLLMDTVKNSSHLMFVPKRIWFLFTRPYKAYYCNEFAGIAAITQLPSFIKIGPMVILPQYQSKGLSKILIESIIQDYSHSHNLFIASSNPRLQKTMPRYKFDQIQNPHQLPAEIIFFLFQQMWRWMSIDLIWESVRKKVFKRSNPMKFFIRKKVNSF